MSARTARALLVVLLVAAAPVPVVAGGKDPIDRITAPHRVHAENGVECAVCHEKAAASTGPGDRLGPAMDVCAACHDVTSDSGCAACHANVEAAGSFAPRAPYLAQKFSHAAHVGRGLKCAACHGEPAGEPRLPAMSDCRACHSTSDAPGDCLMCHAGTMKLRPDSHDALWVTRHGGQARVDATTCGGCHTQTACQECHSGDDVRPRVHPLDFAFSHSVVARNHELDCATCHGEPEFCRSCHVAEHVLPRTHARAGWVRLPDGGQHAVEGAFEIESCVACHDGPQAGPDCAECHGD